MSDRYACLTADQQPAEPGAPEHALTLDTRTGLMWTARPLPGRQTHREALAACRDLRLGGFDDWRLPTVDELFALADRSRHSPAIDTEAFPDTPSDWFWTSTPAAWDPSADAWIVYFGYGYANANYRNYDAFVRAVRVAPPELLAKYKGAGHE